MESLYQEHLFKVKKLCDQLQAAGGDPQAVLERFIAFDETGSLFWRLLMQLNVRQQKQESFTALLELLATQRLRLPILIAKLLFEYKLYHNVAPDPKPANQRVIDHCSLFQVIEETLQYECQHQAYLANTSTEKDSLHWRDEAGQIELLTQNQVETRLQKTWFSRATKSLKRQPLQPELAASKFAIAKASPEAGLGLEVLEPIAAGEFLFFYGGVYQKRGKQKGWRYTLHDINRRKSICAEEAINFGGLMLHLPTREVIDNAGFTAKGLAKDQVATQNVSNGLVILNDKEYQVGVFANRALQPGEPLGFDYGWDHWAVEWVSPQLFNRSGALVSNSRFSKPTGIRRLQRRSKKQYFIVSEQAREAFLAEHEAKSWPDLMFFIDHSSA